MRDGDGWTRSLAVKNTILTGLGGITGLVALVIVLVDVILR